MKSLFKDHTGVKIHCLNILEDEENVLSPSSFDTIMLINVLEHIKEEPEFLTKIHELMKPGGKFILLVPAFEWLFGTLDIIVGHERRYKKKVLVRKLQHHGFDPLHTRYMNAIGIFGWWLNGKILKKEEFSVYQIRKFEHLIPHIARLEKLIPPPFGQSILVVSQKPAE
jgi:SAM-dependent methyltransferase